jgi:Xaa-Pro aminopeptidase
VRRMKEFYQQNREKLLQQLEDRSILLLFAGEAPHQSADAFYGFVPNRHFYYMTGIDQPHVVLQILKWGDTIEETLYIEKADPVMEKWEGKKIDAEQAKELSGVNTVRYIDDFEKEFDRLLTRSDYKHLYLDLERRGWDSPMKRSQTFARLAQEKYPQLSIENAYHQISHLRMFKSAHEIEMIKKAIDITNLGIQRMMEYARPGMMEYEIEAHFNFVLNSNGIKHHAFPSIIASGKNATILHYEHNDAKTSGEDLLLIDLGAQYKWYNADISRTFPVSGTFTDRQKAIYNIVLKAELETIEAIKPGVAFKTLNEITKKVLSDGLKELGVIQDESEISKYYYHGVSHFLGLDTHDVGDYRDLILQPGMVITIEPGLYIEEESIGIRIEDDILVTENGYENLSKDIIKTVDEIEAFMKR